LASQQSHWDELRRTADHIETLAKLVGSAESEELRELKRVRDRSKVQEGEMQALQKRYAEQETKLAALQRASLTSKQAVALAQQRSSEYEKRCKDLESELEASQSRFDRSEESRNQLDAEHSLLKLQLEDQELKASSAKDREKKLADEASSLRTQLNTMLADLETLKKNAASQSATKSRWAPPTSSQNGYDSRPESRISITSYPSRASTATPVRQSAYPSLNNKPVSDPPVSDTGSQPVAVWASMHAPRNAAAPTTPRARPRTTYKPSIPSPTPSTVSLAPTQNDDGWWE
jgi:hypothetical protein